jgi:hypothetical protein
MLFAVRNAFEAGLVSASVVSLTEGVLRAMITTKLRIAGVALATSLFVASAGVFAYQGEGASKKEEAPGKASLAPKAALSRILSPRAQKLAWYVEEITKKAQIAGYYQKIGRLQSAAYYTETVQRLSHEWNWMVRHSDEERYPDSAYEPPNNPPSTYEFIPPREWPRSEATSKQPIAENSLGPIAVEDDLAFPLIREKPVDSPRLSDASVRKPSSDPAPSDASVRKPSGDADVRSRIERVERKLDQVLKALEAMNTVQGSGGRFPPKYPNPDLIPAAD